MRYRRCWIMLFASIRLLLQHTRHVDHLMMTVAVILAGLLPILVGTGTGSEIMQRIAAPMVGGMITAPLLSMLVIPVVFRLLRRSTRSAAVHSAVCTTLPAKPMQKA